MTFLKKIDIFVLEKWNLYSINLQINWVQIWGNRLEFAQKLGALGLDTGGSILSFKIKVKKTIKTFCFKSETLNEKIGQSDEPTATDIREQLLYIDYLM